MTDARTLKIIRHLIAPRAHVWRCWSEGALLKQWYCPKPWKVSIAEIDVRPGGTSYIVMNGPEGVGCAALERRNQGPTRSHGL